MASAELGAKAIALCPGVAVYWVNRGLCHFRRKDWARVEEDSRRALALDDASVKGHYLLGCALLDKEDCALAVKEFEKVRGDPRLLKRSSSRTRVSEDDSSVSNPSPSFHCFG
ncbi:E3 ubiquitin-protein ligase CHIP [Triticum urartu]|uniref:E3 ubiquitin-protein ligase CHIP n=1 Tax=Triticum urartu TaxID=4572 RepID=M7ZQB5_TRIUA|nr:E3 ubiquitin-protein ligase CHIP [Triticum urartu]